MSWLLEYVNISNAKMVLQKKELRKQSNTVVNVFLMLPINLCAVYMVKQQPNVNMKMFIFSWRDSQCIDIITSVVIETISNLVITSTRTFTKFSIKI